MTYTSPVELDGSPFERMICQPSSASVGRVSKLVTEPFESKPPPTAFWPLSHLAVTTPWSPDWPLEILSTVSFEEQPGGKTQVTVRWLPGDTSSDLERRTFDEGRDSMKQGWGGTMEQLAGYLNRGRA